MQDLNIDEENGFHCDRCGLPKQTIAGYWACPVCDMPDEDGRRKGSNEQS